MHSSLINSLVWWLTPIIWHSKRLREENLEFEVCLVCLAHIARYCFRKLSLINRKMSPKPLGDSCSRGKLGRESALLNQCSKSMRKHATEQTGPKVGGVGTQEPRKLRNGHRWSPVFGEEDRTCQQSQPEVKRAGTAGSDLSE